MWRICDFCAVPNKMSHFCTILLWKCFSDPHPFMKPLSLLLISSQLLFPLLDVGSGLQQCCCEFSIVALQRCQFSFPVLGGSRTVMTKTITMIRHQLYVTVRMCDMAKHGIIILKDITIGHDVHQDIFLLSCINSAPTKSKRVDNVWMSFK